MTAPNYTDAVDAAIVRRDLCSNRRGAVSVLFATTALPLVMLAALAFDFAWWTQAKAQLDLAADSAAIAAARTAVDAYSQQQTSTQAALIGQTAGTEWFKAETGHVLEATNLSGGTVITPTVTVTATGGIFSATVSYNANVSDVLPKLFNWTRAGGTEISNTASAKSSINLFATVDFLIDNTSSMMIAATDADAAKMIAAAQTFTPKSSVPNGLATTPCTFACHWDANSNDYYGLSRSLKIQLRYDVVQTAVQSAITDMVNIEAVPGTLGVGVYTFGDPAKQFRTVFSEGAIDTGSNCSANGEEHSDGKCGGNGSGANAAITAVKTIVTPVTPDIPNSNFANAMNSLAAAVSNSGTGITTSDPIKSVILVTDGIEDDTNPQSIPSTEGPINSKVCDVMKKKGYTVYVLYTTYSSAPVNLPFNNINLVPYITGNAANDLIPELTACASSPKDIIVASSPADINTGLTTLLNQAVGSATRLTN